MKMSMKAPSQGDFDIAQKIAERMIKDVNEVLDKYQRQIENSDLEDTLHNSNCAALVTYILSDVLSKSLKKNRMAAAMAIIQVALENIGHEVEIKCVDPNHSKN